MNMGAAARRRSRLVDVRSMDWLADLLEVEVFMREAGVEPNGKTADAIGKR
jgi:hypothetical protein